MSTQRNQAIWASAFETLIRSAAWTTSAVVLLIVIFLFKEGLGLFTAQPTAEGFTIAVAPGNPVTKLSAREVKEIHDKKIENWQDVGGNNEQIFIFGMGNLDKFVKEKDLGEHFDKLPDVISGYIQKKPGIILAFPARYLPKEAKSLKIAHITPGDFLFDREWYPTATPAPEFGALPLILGTFWVTLGAIIVALPLGLAVAIYLAELANDRMRNLVKPLVELLAGIPSVVYGFFGLVVIVPMIQHAFHLSVGETALAGSVLLAIIALPTIITVSEDSLRATPRQLKEASLALGATEWQTITKVVVPYAITGISAATILGVGRAVGETMTVLMVTGNAAIIPTSFLMPVRTLSATIAAELGEAPQGGLHYKSLFMVGVVLFLITFLFNLLAQFIAQRNRLVKS